MNEMVSVVTARHKQRVYLRHLILNLALWTCAEEAMATTPRVNDPGRRAPRNGDVENERGTSFRMSYVSFSGNITNATDRTARKTRRASFLSRRALSTKFGKGGESLVRARQARPAGQRGVLSVHTGRDETARTGLFINGF